VTLAARLILAFGLVAILATALVGLSLRDASRQIIEADFVRRIDAAAAGVGQELAYEAESLRGLLAPLCEHDTFVDKALLELERARGEAAALDTERLIGIRHFIPEEARARGLDQLTLVTGDGTVLGADKVSRIGTTEKRLAALVKKKPGAPTLKMGGAETSMEVHCSRTSNGVTLGLVGERRIAKILERIGHAYRLSLSVGDPKVRAPKSSADVIVRNLDVKDVEGLRVVARVSRAELANALEKLDRAIAVTGAAAFGLALVIAIVLARSLSRPLVALAHETREVIGGKPSTVRGRGGREIVELAEAFNRTIDELAAMRKRLAATERIAARREVARQIAHEIKNPLAPIRAAVETLRRLRARDDPAFDEYFEEASATVLEEVHRIANIVTEFTRFNRLPAPNPEPIDLVSVARGVVRLHAAAPDGESTGDPGGPRVELVTEPIPMTLADKDQIIQVLTNLIQNGLDAASAVRKDPRVVVSLGPQSNGRVRIVVRDNGPGVSEAMMARLFEPYATTKEKGTGLGLAIVHRIVFEHGGEIVYRTATKGGAVFEISLPVSGPPLLERPPNTEITGKPESDRSAPRAPLDGSVESRAKG
jgi:two-component system, NtrC family, nitrogen regulation sensor histidine kinase NtrY